MELSIKYSEYYKSVKMSKELIDSHIEYAKEQEIYYQGVSDWLLGKQMRRIPNIIRRSNYKQLPIC